MYVVSVVDLVVPSRLWPHVLAKAAKEPTPFYQNLVARVICLHYGGLDTTSNSSSSGSNGGSSRFERSAVGGVSSMMVSMQRHVFGCI